MTDDGDVGRVMKLSESFVALGHDALLTNRVVVMGEAPRSAKHDVNVGEPLSGRSGRILADCCGVDLWEFMQAFERRNLLRAVPGLAPSGKGTLWPKDLARAAARSVIAERRLEGRRVVFLGGRVLDAFANWVSLPRNQERFRWVDLGAFEVAVAPYPSGVNRWWNDWRHREQAKVFWRDALTRSLTGTRA